MNRTKRMTINLLSAGLLLGVAAARAEKDSPANGTSATMSIGISKPMSCW
jgi:hypothetical protein